MQHLNTYTLFAQADYSCGAYGEGAYNEVCATDQTDGGLAETGYDILVPIFLGVAVLIASAVLLVKRLWRRKSSLSN